MKSLEFCYWLQGLFELQEVQSLNSKQTELIKRHLKMVFAYDKQPNNFCVFMNGYLTIQNPDVINEPQTQVIRQYLDNIFTHEAGKDNKTVAQNTKTETSSTSKPKLESFC
jgi:hypothetical protein